MKNGFERRHYLRAHLEFPIVLKTSRGDIKGKTANISISGLAIILLTEFTEIKDEFEIIIKYSEDQEMPVICKKVWSGPMVGDEAVYNAIGAEFIKILPSDRKILVSMIVGYFRG